MTTRFFVDSTSNDMTRVGGRFVRGDSTAQRLQTRLKIMLGEYFLDRAEGMPFFESILGRSNIAHVRQIYRARILATEGVASLDQLDLMLDQQTRVLSIAFAVNGGAVVQAQLGPVQGG